MLDWGIDHSWTLFLDRDGVINERLMDDYVKKIEEFKFIEGVQEAIKVFSHHFKYIFVVTNQQGIGKGLMSESNLNDIHRFMIQEVEAQGGRIDKCYFAPQLASENSDLRKPNSGMAIRAQHDFEGVDFSRSIMIGDSDSDIEFGKKLGMKTIKISEKKHDSAEADLYLEGLLKFAEILTV
jgi:histidinol-phosphate phosphatase family protein